MKVSFNTEDALYQFFDKSHLPSGITLTDEEWDEFVDRFQNDFAYEASGIFAEMIDNFVSERVA